MYHYVIVVYVSLCNCSICITMYIIVVYVSLCMECMYHYGYSCKGMCCGYCIIYMCVCVLQEGR